MTVPEGFHHHGEKISYRDKDDDYLYHVTPQPEKVIKEGLHPNKKSSMAKGHYRDYSKGKAFLTERSKALWWKDRIDEHLEHQHDDPPETHIVRIHKSKVKNLKPDEVGNRDSGGGSHYSTEPVGHSESQHSENTMTHEEVLKKHGYKKQGSSNVFQHEGGHSVTVGQKGNWVHGKVIGGKNTEHTEGDSASALDAHLGKFHWQRKTTHTNRDRKEILPVSEEVTQHAEHDVFSDATHNGKVKSFAKKFGAVDHPEHSEQFMLPKSKVKDFHTAASKAGMFLKHQSPTGAYHYSSKGGMQYTESDVTQFTEQVLPTAAVVPAMQTSQQFSEPFSTFGSRLAASKSTKKEG